MVFIKYGLFVFKREINVNNWWLLEYLVLDFDDDEG